MLREAGEWFRDYGKAFKYGALSGALLGFDAIYCAHALESNKDPSPLALVLTGFLAGGLVNECGGEIRDTYRMRRIRKEETKRNVVLDAIQ